MTDTPDSSRETTHTGASMSTSGLEDWFVREILPLEPALMQFLRRSLRNKDDADDVCQDVYALVCEAAQKKPPQPVKPFVFTVARNLLINRVRRDQIVSIEAVADLDALGIAVDEPGPDRSVMARQDLHRLQGALDRLPPRCREAVVYRKIEGLSYREIASRMGIGEDTVSEYLTHGMFMLADVLNADAPAQGNPA
jgi:RNA polymerase sigma-70 factor (ECF subfamily)